MTGRRRGLSPAPGPSYRCATCGATFVSYGRAEKHVDQQHYPGGRIETVTPTKEGHEMTDEHQHQDVEPIEDGHWTCKTCLATYDNERAARECWESHDVVPPEPPAPAPRFYPLDLVATFPLAACGICCALISDDREGANRNQHWTALHAPRSGR